MTAFYKLFASASIGEGFDVRIVRTLESRAQLHTDLCDQITVAVTTVALPIGNDGSCPLAVFSDIVESLEDGDIPIKQARLLFAVLAACNAVVGKAHVTPTWALPLVKKPAGKKAATTTTIDPLDLLGSVGKLTDTDILRSIAELVSNRLALLAAVPA